MTKSSRVLSLGVTLLAAIAGIGLSGSAAYASTVEHRDAYVLTNDQTVVGNLYLRADTVEIAGTVEGDLVVVAHSLKVTGHVGGSILGLVGDVKMNGVVGGSVRLMSLTSTIGGRVGSDITVVGSDLIVPKENATSGSLYYFGNTSDIQGSIAGATEQQMVGKLGELTLSTYLFGLLMSLLSVALLGALVYVFQSRELREGLREKTLHYFFSHVFIGLFGFLTALIIATVCFVIPIGFWVAILVLSGITVLMVLSIVDVGYLIGGRLLARSLPGERHGMARLMLGLFCMVVLSAVPILGIIPFIIYLACLGTRLESLWPHQMRRQQA